jgi:5-bromo-4-chloroindolyl phosphate hydrolysis protein
MYLYGGFGIPFYIVGSIITFLAVSLIFLLPIFPTNAEKQDSKNHKGTEQRNNMKIEDILKVLSC